MIIRFRNGSAIDALSIASMRVEKATTGQYPQKDRIIVDTWRESFSLMGGRPTASHFMHIDFDSYDEAVSELKTLTAAWTGLPLEIEATHS